ncbi:MAG: prepilin-type N-terminal cleavage/methylation domain-containing protein [Candidatus Pacebacteria bacterium]|nr:prepilin-type N-terminal cleavage/methylation domain-containing protein [Candidatus Paceibacterota bacterium]
MQKLKIKINAGFTVVELLVSMAIFVILVGIVSGIFVNSLRIQKAVISLMATNDNSSLVLESIARDIRTGSNFCISDFAGSCIVGDVGTAFRFTNANGGDSIYRLDPLEKSIQKSEDLGVSFERLTSSLVDIKIFEIRLVDLQILNATGGLGIGEEWPSRVNLFLKVGSKDPKLTGIFTDLQMTTSARNF